MKNKNIVILKKPFEFARIIKQHEVFNNVTFKVRVTPNKLGILRYGLAVNKKNFPTAVARNKIKRQLRQIIRNLNVIKAIDMIIVVKSNYFNNSYLTNTKFFNEVYNLIP